MKYTSWDTRTPDDPVTKMQAHDREILSVGFNPAIDYLLLTGSADKVAIYPFSQLKYRH